METVIFNNSPETEKISDKNEDTLIECLNSLTSKEKKKKKTKKITKKKQKSKKKYTGLKDLLDDISNKNATRTNKKDSELKPNEKTDDSEINFSEKIEIETGAEDVSESDLNEFGELSISSKTEINTPTISHENFSRKTTSIENEQLNNINTNNNKRKIINSICDYYNGCDKFLSETETSTIDLSNSLNFIKKEKFEENFSEEIENNISNININEDFENNNVQNISNNNFQNIYNNNFQNINNNNSQNINNNNFQNICNNNYNYKLKFLGNSKNEQNLTRMQEIVLLDSKYSKFDIYNNDYYVNYKFNVNGNYIVRRRGDWICDKCGNYNYSFRDVCNRCNKPKF